MNFSCDGVPVFKVRSAAFKDDFRFRCPQRRQRHIRFRHDKAVAGADIYRFLYRLILFLIENRIPGGPVPEIISCIRQISCRCRPNRLSRRINTAGRKTARQIFLRGKAGRIGRGIAHSYFYNPAPSAGKGDVVTGCRIRAIDGAKTVIKFPGSIRRRRKESVCRSLDRF